MQQIKRRIYREDDDSEDREADDREVE